ncbi:hypothetical protein [Ferrovibrio sp.]|uniref:hypothetical protein n=1 Tax=Ferrovibrio sp. TaxID=1917215 RepID=UPI00311E2087
MSWNDLPPTDRKRLQELANGIGRLIEPTLRAAEGFARNVQPVVKTIGEVAQALKPVFDTVAVIARHSHQCEMLDKAGWLPHRTSPFELLQENLVWNSDEVRQKVDAYYRENWEWISAEFLSAVEDASIDDEAKMTFGEAITAHGHGLYRVAPRLLFPEVERIVGDILHKDEGMPRKISSLRKLADVADEYLPGSIAALNFHKRLRGHLYEHIKSSEDLAGIVDDPIPNRHAVVHGLVSYKTAQSSINAMILTLYIFQMLSVYLERDAKEASLSQ